MPAQDQARKVLIVSSERQLVQDVRRAVGSLGGGWSVEQMDSLRLATGFVGQVDVVIVFTGLSWRVQYRKELLHLIKTLTAGGSTVFVICPRQDQDFVQEAESAGARDIIYEGYDVGLLRQLLASVPVPAQAQSCRQD